MSANEVAIEASASEGLPYVETSTAQVEAEMADIVNSDDVNVLPVEVTNIEMPESVTHTTDENNDAGKAENIGLTDSPYKELNEGDGEMATEKDLAENAKDEMAKAKDKQKKVETEDKVEGGTKEIKVVSRHAKMRKNKRMGTRAAVLLTDTAGTSTANNNDGEVKAEKVDQSSAVAADGTTEGEKSKGFIFMCNAKTKKDCFDYKIFGLPEGRRETVAKIYKGMKLFLYDIDLKLLYGIYEAATPGGYNIEPKAFKSKFPSQVRFTVVEDCVPVSEEIFRKAIKENYSRRNMFNCLLSAEQVRQLRKLLKNVNRRSQLKRKAEERRGGTSNAAKRRINNDFERGWRGVHPNDRYGRAVFPDPVPSYPSASHLPAVAAPPALPGYSYRAVDYYRREAPVEMYSRDPHGYYRDSLYPPGPSAGYYGAGLPRYHY